MNYEEVRKAKEFYNQYRGEIGFNPYDNVTYLNTRPRYQYKKSNVQKLSKGLNQLNTSYKEKNNTLQKILKQSEQLFTLLSVATLGILAFKSSDILKAKKEQEPTNYRTDITRMSPDGITYLKNRERFIPKATRIKDNQGRLEKYYTIGYGHNGPDVKPGQTITKEEAEELFKKDIQKYEKTVAENVKVPITQNQFDAMVSLCYNIGQNAFVNSTVVKRLNQGDYEGAKQAFMMWNKKDKIEQPGLTTRRKEEMKMWDGGDKLAQSEKGRKVGGYKFKSDSVKISTPMENYLNRIQGKGIITSGMELTSEHAVGPEGDSRYTKTNPSKKSHYYGGKIDVVPLRGRSNEDWANTAIPFLLDSQTITVDFEAFPSYQYKEIKNIIFEKSPEIKQLVTKKPNLMKNSLANSNTTAPHLDILIDTDTSYTKDKYNLGNKNDTKLKQQIEKQNKPKQNKVEQKSQQTQPTMKINIPSNNKPKSLFDDLGNDLYHNSKKNYRK